MADTDPSPPDGIDRRHADPPRRRRRSSPLSAIMTGLVLTAALLGWFGGQPHGVRTAGNDRVRLTLRSPETLRSGMFFETRAIIEPRQPIGEVVLALSPALWRDITINSSIPAPQKEEYAEGMIRMSYGPGEPGKPIAIKIDGQVNPPLIGDIEGEVAIYDGDQRLVAIPFSRRIFP